MDLYEKIEVHDCPVCGGAALLDEEKDCGFFVSCLDCGCRTVNVNYSTEEEKLSAAERIAKLWNAGKVISSEPGE